MILETGELEDPDLIAQASRLSLEAGADFIKTSTGKDGVNASLLIAEAAAWAKSQGKTLYDILQEIYKTYGYYVEKVVSVTLPGKDGLAKMQEIMKNLRANPPKDLGGKPILAVRDYLTDKRTAADGTVTAYFASPPDRIYAVYYEVRYDPAAALGSRVSVVPADRGAMPAFADDATVQ